MRIHDFNELRPAPEWAVVINVGTELITALAAASVLRHAKMPLLVVNCTPGRVQTVFFDVLSDQWGFTVIDMKLAEHGATLDRLFQLVPAERLLCVDSDAEILDGSQVERMKAAFDDPQVYGSGWIHEASWLSAEQSGMLLNGEALPTLYRERPWMPCAMFRVAYVRSALASGASFREAFVLGSAVPNWDFPGHLLSQQTPAAAHSDTGGLVHGWAQELGFRFDGPSTDEVSSAVTHYHGVSRLALLPEGQNGTPLDMVEDSAIQRLTLAYGETLAGFKAAADACRAL